MSKKAIVPSGIPTLDILLGGGIPPRQSLVITGAPGSGKTVLCSQIAFAQAALGRRTIIATVASESQEKLLDELRGFSFYTPDYVGDQIYLVSIYGALQRGAKDAKDLLLKAMRDRRAELLFVDGLRSLRDLWRDEAKLRDFLYEINVGIAQQGGIGLFTTEYTVDKLMEYPEATTVDGIVSLTTRHVGGRTVRRAQVVKLRGRNHLTSEHLMHITDGGVRIVPRLEETVSFDERYAPTDERAEFGVPELDRMLHGGLPMQSSTIFVGSTGVGKTLLCLRFAAVGAHRGEPSLLISYSEPVERLVARARRVGLDVGPLVEQGSLTLQYVPAINIEADDLVASILAAVESSKARRVVIDGLGELESSVIDKERIGPVLNALLVQLRRAGVTSIFTKELAKLAGADLDFSGTPIALAAENILIFRHMELGGKFTRSCAVLKMRESAHDAYVREFQIRTDGFLVLNSPASTEGSPTGASRPAEPAAGDAG